ncbi:MAG: DNA internalization-related competence protein ComEC/Rec2 [Thiomicrospira sp.]|uniref:DNA internalization-related competence protein ComEC/Rec2 n=1 Tax=Thiomicrospira sp. TaxID=935 RepID=UPI001A0B3CC4|nr:DNA internalization-related competence protein ComEC/Rec2 [Thiomicrospira sp.]MBE0493256.1 DNA internalization-related competence protein ComEC/Rec2 [Thiomicrospira sp.]
MFIWFSLGFIGVIFGLYQLDVWPSWFYGLPMVLILGVAVWRAWPRIAHLILGFIIGWIWLSLSVFLTPNLPESMMTETLWVEGRVVGLVQSNASESNRLPIQRFEMRLSQLENLDQTYHQAWWFPKPLIRLSCYRCDWTPEPSETYRLAVRIKPIHGSMNPGGFDYEAWAHQQGLKASGYVRINESEPIFIKRGFDHHQIRAALGRQLDSVWGDSRFAGIYNALLYADRQAISDDDWTLMRATGTIHLMAISGLHLALVALMGYGIGRLIWRLPIRVFERYPVHWFGSAVALLLATGYGLLAGFSIPTQRAWIMVAVTVVFLLLRRQFQPWSVLLLAAFLVVAWHPSSVLSQGFWLSFLAVGLIFLVLNQSVIKTRPVWQKAVLIQLVLSLGLAPALWWFYQQVPLYSLVANLVAVPFVSFVGLPLLFITTLVSYVSTDLSAMLVWLNDYLWAGLWWFLNAISQWPLSEWRLWPIALWQVVLVYGLVFGGFLFRAAYANHQSKVGPFLSRLKPSYAIKILALGLAIGVLFWPNKTDKVPYGEFWLSLLDVGQGQALVIETQHKTLVYDTGPIFGSRFDGAQIAISPYLHYRGHQSIDLLMVSHADRDHAGGAPRLVKDWPIKTRLTGQVERLKQSFGLGDFEVCQAQQTWEWDGVKFEVLAPGLFVAADHNDHSCVLKVTAGQSSVMITGDLSSKHEDKLIAHYGADFLQSSVLIAGHHGSRHSTNQAWLQALQSDLVLFSAGYRNAFGFPAQQTLQRLETEKIDWLNTACEGAVQIHFTPKDWQVFNLWRVSKKRWFHHQCELAL